VVLDRARVLAGGLCVWRAVDRSMARLALQAISEEEEAAASIGIPSRAQSCASPSSRRS